MNDPIENKSAPWTQAKNWVAGLTAVLIVLPSLINAGTDVYKTIFKIPRTDMERTNVDLFEKYFGKPPISTSSLEVKNGPGKIDVKFAIYEEGDVYVEYGNVTQWFPLPKTVPHTTSKLSLMSSAFAAEATDKTPQGAGSYTQSDNRDGDYIVRVRVYANGVIETLRIDPRTGQVVERTAIQR